MLYEIKERIYEMMKKRMFTLVLSIICIIVFTGCGKKEEDTNVPDTAGGKIQQLFLDTVKENPDITSQELADTLIFDKMIPFSGATMPVEEGWLAGFDTEITGFSDGVMFSPMIGTIPFVGYIFTVDESTSDDFMKTLQDNANLRWNICTEADEMIVDKSGDKVFFLMCPSSFDE